jgi:DNA-binding XRE family transcriptional regulator
VFFLKHVPFLRLNTKFTRRETLIFFKLVMLKELIKSKGIKQKWLALKLGVSEVTVSNWVKEKSMPSQKHLAKLSEVLNIPVKELTN